MTVLHRASLVDLELRGSDGRTVVGLCCPFDRPTEIADATGRYVEVFRRGAFARTIAERGSRIKLLGSHDARSFPLGRATKLTEDNAGLVGEFRIARTAAGDEALALLNDGTLDGLSVGFTPVEGGDRWNRGRTEVERLEVRLREVSLVSFPAFDDARVMAVRSADSLPLDAARARLALLEKAW